MADELGLAEAIDAVRTELRRAQDSGRGSGVRFSVGSVEIEFVVEVVKTAGGEASVKVFNMLSLGGKGQVARGETNRVKVVLTPIGVGGQPFEVASERDHRPDGSDDGDGGPSSVDQGVLPGAVGSERQVSGRPGG